MSSVTNGQIRKSLASQLDRLDTILDTLGDGLNQAVATAVQEAVGIAVREAITGLVTEVLTNPDVLAQLRALLGPVVAQGQQPMQASSVASNNGLKEVLARAWSGIKAGAQAIRRGTSNGLRRAWQWTRSLLARCRLLGRFRRQLLISVGVGTALAVAAYFAGPYVAAAVGWLGGFATSLGVQASLAWKRLKLAATT